jgi:SAM-dependent methyltransferase
MKNIYQDGTYIVNNPTWHEGDSTWKASQINKIIRKNALNFLSICEVGCGAGEIIKQLSEQLGKEKKYFGYEISEIAFEVCKKKKQPTLSYFLKDITEEEDNKFDIILCIDVFEHIQDYLGFLSKLKNKATYKIFHIPLDLSVQSIFRISSIIKKRYKVGHLHYFTKDIALSVLSDLEYEVIDYFYTGSSIDLPCQSIKSKFIRFPRKVFFYLNNDVAVKVLGGYSLLVLTK